MSEITSSAFSMFIAANKVNPNGDPTTGQPRIDSDGYGIITDVSIKRKIRNTLQAMGENIFIKADEFADDGCNSLVARFNSNAAIKDACAKSKKGDAYAVTKAACKEWLDVRLFGYVMAAKGVSSTFGVRGCVSVKTGISLDPIGISDVCIIKSVNTADVEGRSPDRVGARRWVDFGMYRVDGFINPLIAKRNGVTEHDIKAFKEALVNIFMVDGSVLRPSGAMCVAELDWMEYQDGVMRYRPEQFYSFVKAEKKTERPEKAGDYAVSIEAPKDVKVERLVKMAEG